MYCHGMATLALAELWGQTGDDDIRPILKKATDLIVNTQNKDGGWRYFPVRREADISVTVCQIMALRAARNAGVAVPKNTVDACVRYVKGCQDRREGWFRYMRRGGGGGGQQGFARTAAGVVALYSAGIYKGVEVQKGLDYLMRNCRPGNMANQPFRQDFRDMLGDFVSEELPVGTLLDGVEHASACRPCGDELATMQTLQDSLPAYQEKLRAGTRNASAAYELALRSSRPYQPGDQVSYYVAGDWLRVTVNEAAKLATSWDPQTPDENTAYYLGKLRELYEKFRPLIEQECLVPVTEDEAAPVQGELFPE